MYFASCPPNQVLEESASNVFDCAMVMGGTAEKDCNNECGGGAEEDACGVCGGPGIPNGDCDCDGNTFDCDGECGGLA